MIEPPSSPPATCPPQLTRPLVLVGLMGAGKTSVGKRLAQLLGVDFTDSDAEIERAAGMTVPDIFARLGEPAFRDGERRVIARLLAERPGVLATGGGAFVEPTTRDEIAAHGTSVWLRAELPLLWDRVRDRPGHDRRYAIDSSKLRAELGWKPLHTDFESGLRGVVDWYMAHRDWWEPAKAATEARYRAQGL